MITRLSAENYRLFKKSVNIELKPITIFLGANSIGKSSLLRIIPLFKQSILYNRDEPIVWYDDNLVDLGNFNISKNKYSDSQQPMSFSFEYEINNKNTEIKKGFKYGLSAFNRKIYLHRTFLLHKEIDRNLLASDKIIVTVDLNLSKIDNKSKVHYSNINIQFLDYQITIKDGKITVNGLEAGEKIDETEEEILKEEIIDIHNYNLINPRDVVEQKILKNFHVHGRGKDEYKKQKFLNVPFSDKDTFKKKIEELTNKNNDTDLLYNFVGLLHIKDILDTVNMELANILNNCQYIAPLREEAHRFYRMTSRTALEPNGNNAANMIHQFSAKEKERWEKFTINSLNLKFSIDANAQNGNISVLVTDNAKNIENNLVDTGSGFSQILPILLSLWKHKENNNVLLIEQPELHLHPKFQRMFADTLSNSINSAPIIIETHSKFIVDELGSLIKDSDSPLTEEDINIVMFEYDETSKTTKIRETYFDKNGNINFWPLGFLR